MINQRKQYKTEEWTELEQVEDIYEETVDWSKRYLDEELISIALRNNKERTVGPFWWAPHEHLYAWWCDMDESCIVDDHYIRVEWEEVDARYGNTFGEKYFKNNRKDGIGGWGEVIFDFHKMKFIVVYPDVCGNDELFRIALMRAFGMIKEECEFVAASEVDLVLEY